MGRPAQAGTGSAGELTPCTTAAAPACRAQGQPREGRARQAPRSWGDGPGKDKGQPGCQRSPPYSAPLVPSLCPWSPPPYSARLVPRRGCFWGLPCVPRADSGPGLGGISLARDVFQVLSPEPVPLSSSHRPAYPDWTGGGRSSPRRTPYPPPGPWLMEAHSSLPCTSAPVLATPGRTGTHMFQAWCTHPRTTPGAPSPGVPWFLEWRW